MARSFSRHSRCASARWCARATAFVVMLALAMAGGAAPAQADGDPASDVLTTQPLFLPQDAAIPAKQQAQLAGLLQEAARSGYPIRVAVVASSADLGSVTELWRQPQTYARFLGQELSLVYRGPLLVVMPDGFGFEGFKPPLTYEHAAVAGLSLILRRTPAWCRHRTGHSASRGEGGPLVAGRGHEPEHLQPDLERNGSADRACGRGTDRRRGLGSQPTRAAATSRGHKASSA